MSKVDRNNPKRSSASESRYSLMDFERDFPDDAACLDFLVMMLYPDGIFCPTCDRITKHHRDVGRPSYSCQYCGHHEHPMVGTIFENSATSLKLWFYAMYLMASTRCGISAKQLERELGVTYKTAWRMFNRIRSLLQQENCETLNGTVEMDEAYIGGKAKWWNRGLPLGLGRGAVGKTPVFGMAQRGTLNEKGKRNKNGKIAASVVPDAAAKTLLPGVATKVLPKSAVYTDEHRAYDGLAGMGHPHGRVRHTQHVYLMGDVHTNTIEGFWSLLRRGISSVYHDVSTTHVQAYVDEYVFRYNNRDAADDNGGMFGAFMAQVEKAPRNPLPVDPQRGESERPE